MIEPLVGGALIGVAATWLLGSIGRIAGVSGIFAQALRVRADTAWAALFLVGLGIGAWLAQPVVPTDVRHDAAAITWLTIAGGALVGVGTRLGSGCTSGHGVCGIARLSRRSIAATLTFMATGMATATLVHG